MMEYLLDDYDFVFYKLNFLRNGKIFKIKGAVPKVINLITFGTAPSLKFCLTY